MCSDNDEVWSINGLGGPITQCGKPGEFKSELVDRLPHHKDDEAEGADGTADEEGSPGSRQVDTDVGPTHLLSLPCHHLS